MDENCNKIILVCLNQQISLEVGKTLSRNLDMMFCNAKDLVEYELIDVNTLKNIASKEYLDQAERKVFAHIASFENVVVDINFQLFIKNINIIRKNSIVVFLKVPITFLKEPIEKIMFNSHTEKLKKLADITVQVDTTNSQEVCNKIIQAIGGII